MTPSTAPTAAAQPRRPRSKARREATAAVAGWFPRYVAVELSAGFRVYRLPLGSMLITREEVEVYGTLVGWCDAYCGTSLPRGMTAADVASLPRAERAPAPPPIAVDIVAWCKLPVDVREGLWTYSPEKRPGLITFGALSPSSRRWIEHRLEEHGLARIERTAELDVWGTR